MSRLDELASGNDIEDDRSADELENRDPSTGIASKRKTEDNEDEEKIKKSEKKKARRFTEDVLIGRDGIQRIYEEFPNACKFRGRGFEASDMKRMMGLYKEWSFQMFQNLAFEDVLSSTERLGSKAKVRNAMKELRDKERERYLKEVHGVVISNLRTSDSPSSNNNRNSTEFDASTIPTTNMSSDINSNFGNQNSSNRSPVRAGTDQVQNTSLASIPSTRPPIATDTESERVQIQPAPTTPRSAAGATAGSAALHGFLLSAFDETCLPALQARAASVVSRSTSLTSMTATASASKSRSPYTTTISSHHPGKSVANKEDDDDDEEAEFDYNMPTNKSSLPVHHNPVIHRTESTHRNVPDEHGNDDDDDVNNNNNNDAQDAEFDEAGAHKQPGATRVRAQVRRRSGVEQDQEQSPPPSQAPSPIPFGLSAEDTEVEPDDEQPYSYSTMLIADADADADDNDS